jgi:ZIP family zinc transporter
MWMIVILISGACAALGYLIIQKMPVLDGRYTQAFAAGAMLTMLADAMMPEAFEHGGKLVGIFTVMGFLTAAMLTFL